MCSAVPQWSCFVEARESRIQFAKCSDMSIAVMKGLRFPYTQESCFDVWYSSHMGCSSFLCGRFVDSQESRFRPSKRSNMGSSVLLCSRSADVQEFFHTAKLSDMSCAELLILRMAFAGCETFR